MMRKIKKTKAVSTLEYTLLILVILGSLFLMQKHIVRGFAGRWKDTGDAFGGGKQYDPENTTECLWSEEANEVDSGKGWYELECSEEFIEDNFDSCVDECDIDGTGGSCLEIGKCGFGPGHGCCLNIGPFNIICYTWCRQCCIKECKKSCLTAAALGPCSGGFCQ
ncbi:MAG: hypothetical protein ABIJ41_03850 [Candidatus Omnitrophota bacterium]